MITVGSELSVEHCKTCKEKQMHVLPLVELYEDSVRTSGYIEQCTACGHRVVIEWGDMHLY